MPETTCAPRVDALSSKTAELRNRRDELGLLIDETPTSVRPTREHLDVLRDHIRGQVGAAVPDTVQAMTVKIDVTSRQSITPTFRIPAPQGPSPTAAAAADPKVRILPGSVPPTWHCANLNLQVDGLPFALGRAHAKIRRDGYRM